MKYYFFLTGLICSFSVSMAQTNTFPSSGNAGIGVVNPTTSLYIQNANSTYDPTIILKNTANTIASRAGFTFENNAGKQTMFYKQSSGNPDANDLILYSAEGDTRIYTAGLEQFRITNSGNIGIGTSTPNAKLHVYGRN